MVLKNNFNDFFRRVTELRSYLFSIGDVPFHQLAFIRRERHVSFGLNRFG